MKKIVCPEDIICIKNIGVETVIQSTERLLKLSKVEKSEI